MKSILYWWEDEKVLGDLEVMTAERATLAIFTVKDSLPPPAPPSFSDPASRKESYQVNERHCDMSLTEW